MSTRCDVEGETQKLSVGETGRLTHRECHGVVVGDLRSEGVRAPRAVFAGSARLGDCKRPDSRIGVGDEPTSVHVNATVLTSIARPGNRRVRTAIPLSLRIDCWTRSGYRSTERLRGFTAFVDVASACRGDLFTRYGDQYAPSFDTTARNVRHKITRSCMIDQFST